MSLHLKLSLELGQLVLELHILLSLVKRPSLFFYKSFLRVLSSSFLALVPEESTFLGSDFESLITLPKLFHLDVTLQIFALVVAPRVYSFDPLCTAITMFSLGLDFNKANLRSKRSHRLIACHLRSILNFLFRLTEVEVEKRRCRRDEFIAAQEWVLLTEL